MFEVDIPGFGHVTLKYLASDFTGTLSMHGRLVPGVKELLNRVAAIVDIHVLTADTFGTARSELAGVECRLHVLEGNNEDVQKEAYVQNLGAEHVIALERQDRKMLKTARIGIAVCLTQGCALEAALSSNILMTSATDALELLLQDNRLKATLRF